ncbi:MarR family transcriptional regulator [Salinibacterium sp. dk2585]|uniref:MarR family winged helix-turn-helix transcriptional regulator n=1 Tax=unclassified Salinibacterium TaxID=2632331 RepID=UPI0011C25601|nr:MULTISPECIES: MarR family transcriptional regulator [unclassified Salinibacterium]QEE60275.1 MarR family transcriptional regulator [Salinibacterium sp. dk2585]TXK55347.1 MarR family transcriptional regulator [Salinibacterium sp. dk5596]
MAERPIGYWLKLVDRLIDERFAAIIEEHGVTRRQWQLLSVLSASSATLEQLDLAVAPFVEPGSSESAAEHLGELRESGWVTVTDGEYAITERGTIAFTRLSEVVDGLRNSLAKDFTEEEYLTTVNSLERMARNLGYTD